MLPDKPLSPLESLFTVDFSPLRPGDELFLWVQEFESGSSTVQMPMFPITVPTEGDEMSLLELILHTLTTPLSKIDPEDIAVFHKLVAALARSVEDTDEIGKLVSAFYKRNSHPILPFALLRVGRHIPYANSVKKMKKNSFCIRWTG